MIPWEGGGIADNQPQETPPPPMASRQCEKQDSPLCGRTERIPQSQGLWDSEPSFFFCDWERDRDVCPFCRAIPCCAAKEGRRVATCHVDSLFRRTAFWGHPSKPLVILTQNYDPAVKPCARRGLPFCQVSSKGRGTFQMTRHCEGTTG